MNQLAVAQVLVQVLEDAVHAMDSRPVARVFVGAGVGVVGFPDIEQEEARAIHVETHVLEHGSHVVVALHQLELIEVLIDGGLRVQDRHAHQSIGSVPNGVSQVRRKKEPRHHLAELHAFKTETLGVPQEVFFVVLARIDVRWTGMRQEAHQQVVVRRCSPGGVAVALLDLAEL